MNWIKNKFKAWFREQCKEAWSAEVPGPCVDRGYCIPKEDSIVDNRKSYNVRMQPANGGTIIEVSHFNERISEFNRDLFIVQEGEDLGSEISKILVQYKLTHN